MERINLIVHADIIPRHLHSADSLHKKASEVVRNIEISKRKYNSFYINKNQHIFELPQNFPAPREDLEIAVLGCYEELCCAVVHCNLSMKGYKTYIDKESCLKMNE